MEVNGVEFADEVDAAPLKPKNFKQRLESISEWLIRKNVAKSPIQANAILIVTILLSLTIATAAFIYGSRKPVAPTPLQELQFSHMGQHHTP